MRIEIITPFKNIFFRNSALEAIKFGVPVVALPQFAEQRQNAAMLEQRTETAIRIKKDELTG